MVPPSFSLSILRGPADLLQTLGASSADSILSGPYEIVLFVLGLLLAALASLAPRWLGWGRTLWARYVRDTRGRHGRPRRRISSATAASKTANRDGALRFGPASGCPVATLVAHPS